MAFGLESTGFTLKRLTDIITSLRAKAVAVFGPNITTDEDSVFGQIISVHADEVATLWEGLQEVYNSQKPDAAEGVPLDDVADLNGVTRLPATPSTASVVLTGTPATVIPATSLISVVPTKEQFSLLAATTLDPAAPVGVLCIASGADATYTITINATPFSHVSVAETAIQIVAALKLVVDAGVEPITFTDNLDGTFRLDAVDPILPYTLALTAEMTITEVSSVGVFDAVNTGPTAAPVGTLTTIESPLFGWDTASNPQEAALGSNVETDTQLRLRRRASTSIAGAGTVDAITANLLQVTGVTDAFVVENRTFSVDSGGRPPKSFEAVVTGGVDAVVAQVIWDRKPAGIETFGSLPIAVEDSLGNARTVNLSRPTDVFIHLQIDYTLYTEEVFPSDGESAMATAVVAEGNLLGINDDVIIQRLHSPIFSSVAGIATLVIRIATSATSGGAPGAFQTTNLAVAATDIARFDVSRVTVTKV